ncbi:MAG: hypothetical protein JF589_14130 [Gemmatimonadetes bacterium]|nr:hypothetical protein [Gemmatimonadota bacterium]
MRVGFRSWPIILMTAVLSAMVLLDGCGAKHPRADDGDRLAATTGTPLARACDHTDQDTTHYLHTPLYRACAVSVKARPIANDVRPDFRPTGRDRPCFSAVIQVAVDTAGFAENRTLRVVRATDPGFAAAVIAIVPAMRFEPARLGERRVRQLYELREVMVIRQGRSVFGSGTGPRPVASGTRGFSGGIGGGGMTNTPSGSSPGSQLPTSAPPMC